MLFLSAQNTLDIKSFDFKPQIPSSATILQYKDRISPKVTLRLDNEVIDDILIDTGFYGDLSIDEHYIEKLKSNHSCDSMINTFLTLFDTHTVKDITFSELYINERLYKNIHVVQLKKRLLGSKFLKRLKSVKQRQTMTAICLTDYHYPVPIVCFINIEFYNFNLF